MSAAVAKLGVLEKGFSSGAHGAAKNGLDL
jgi:hypothetical protein